MADQLTTIIDTCRGTQNKHFKWFARLIENHFEGILSHVTYRISSGKIEGINNRSKQRGVRHMGMWMMDIFS